MNRNPVSLATKKSAPILGIGEQIAFYVLGGIAIPAVMWSVLRGTSVFAPEILVILTQLTIANLLCWYTLGKLRGYARARLLSYVLPTNLVIFGVILAFNAVTRQGFSYSLLVTCAAGTLAMSYVVTARIRRANPRMQHLVVPGGNADSILSHQGFNKVQSAIELEQLIDANAVSGSIVADLHHDHSREWERLLAKAALKGVPVYHYRLLEESLTGEVRISHLRENELGSLVPNLPYRTAKRALDLVGVIAALPFIVPAMGLVALAIRLDSKGSVLFFQERLGFQGEKFRMVKFRTMREREVSEEENARRDDAITKDDDNRVTRIGRVLRKSRLDELPQVWNIACGHMSWIGPRPEALALAGWYEDEIPFYNYRHIVRPGITGWAQVNQGHVADLDSIQTKLRFDFFYIKNLSLWLDVLIALKTLRVIARGIGAK